MSGQSGRSCSCSSRDALLMQYLPLDPPLSFVPALTATRAHPNLSMISRTSNLSRLSWGANQGLLDFFFVAQHSGTVFETTLDPELVLLVLTRYVCARAEIFVPLVP